MPGLDLARGLLYTASMPHDRYQSDEIAERGKAIYERRIRPQRQEEHDGKILVIDVESGDYEIDQDHLAAVKRAREKRPDAVLFAMRIGFPALARIGGRMPGAPVG